MSNLYDNPKIPILMYHSISLNATPKYKPFAVPPSLFAEHMAYLHQHAYTPITVTQFINTRNSSLQTLPERPVILTFDDGFADFFTDAVPVLQKYGFTATLYIATGFVGDESHWMLPEGEASRPIVTWDQVSKISVQGIECGGHSHWHHQLDTLPLAEARDEIVRCKKLLEDHVGREISSFAYPHGYHSTTVKRLVQEAGYTSACTVGYAMSSVTTDPFALLRLRMGADTGVDALAALLTQPIPSALTTVYKRCLTSVWRFARRCSTSAPQHLQERQESY